MLKWGEIWYLEPGRCILKRRKQREWLNWWCRNDVVRIIRKKLGRIRGIQRWNTVLGANVARPNYVQLRITITRLTFLIVQRVLCRVLVTSGIYN